ncbi:MAG: hypothetical protein ACRDF4_06910 [Rhabdochlamydiaceae bacterium]
MKLECFNDKFLQVRDENGNLIGYVPNDITEVHLQMKRRGKQLLAVFGLWCVCVSDPSTVSEIPGFIAEPNGLQDAQIPPDPTKTKEDLKHD